MVIVIQFLLHTTTNLQQTREMRRLKSTMLFVFRLASVVVLIMLPLHTTTNLLQTRAFHRLN